MGSSAPPWGGVAQGPWGIHTGPQHPDPSPSHHLLGAQGATRTEHCPPTGPSVMGITGVAEPADPEWTGLPSGGPPPPLASRVLWAVRTGTGLTSAQPVRPAPTRKSPVYAQGRGPCVLGVGPPWARRGSRRQQGPGRLSAEGMLRGPCPLDAWLAWSRGPGQKVSLLSGRPGCRRPPEGLARGTPPPASCPQAAGSLGTRPRGEHPGDAGAGSCGITHLFELGGSSPHRGGR